MSDRYHKALEETEFEIALQDPEHDAPDLPRSAHMDRSNISAV